MNELSRHIEKLLLSHDCVIVPQLGGFVTQYVSARHVGCENLFLPPRRTVGFNPQLKLNDGLLVQSYMQAHETSYRIATEKPVTATRLIRVSWYRPPGDGLRRKLPVHTQRGRRAFTGSLRAEFIHHHTAKSYDRFVQ